jgi:hypothetical protein
MRREEVMRLFRFTRQRSSWGGVWRCSDAYRGCFFPRIAWANESRLDEAVAENDRKVRRGQANQIWQ